MIEIQNLKKSYGDHVIWEELSFSLREDGIYCLMGPSGQGKTTLLRCLAGLEKADAGRISGMEGKRISMVFQEDRLIADRSAVSNLKLVGVKDPLPWLKEILPEESLRQPVSTFSGGMKRRTAAARAIAAESEILLMDEPFTGLDEETREEVIQYILRHRRNRLLVITTHEPEDVLKLHAERILLQNAGSKTALRNEKPWKNKEN